MLKILHYTGLRRKFILTAISILCTAVLLFAAFYLFLRASWIERMQTRSVQLAYTIEDNLQAEDDRLTAQLVNAYASAQLLEDAIRVFGSHSFDEYMAARLESSRATTVPLRSFPEYLRSYVRHSKSALYMVAFHGNGVMHTLHYGSGEIRYAFNVPAHTPPGIQEGFAIRKTIYNPQDNYNVIGDISFFFKTSSIVGGMDFSYYTQAELRDRNGNRYNLKGGALEDPVRESSALVQESIRFSYQMLTYIDDGTIISANIAIIIAFLIAMAVICAGSILFFAYHTRCDALFLDDIFAVIRSIKQGAFDSAVGPEKIHNQQNEYGMIARELGDMSMQLKRYIQAEYQFKIQQQQAEMRILQNQINPHFLYNVLESISAQALINNDRPTADAITALGSLFREMIRMPPQVSMKDEVHMLNTYLRVMEFKCAGNFIYHVDLAQELRDFPTVKFWLQPLAENFFVHGFNPHSRYNLLIVKGYTDGATVCIDMMDNGAAIDETRLGAINEGLLTPTETDSVGLHNVYDRLSLFYNGGVSLTINNSEGSGIIIRVRIQREAQNV